MKIENLPNLSKGQIIQVFLTIGGYVKGEFAGVTNDTLLMNNCIAKKVKTLQSR